MLFLCEVTEVTSQVSLGRRRSLITLNRVSSSWRSRYVPHKYPTYTRKSHVAIKLGQRTVGVEAVSNVAAGKGAECGPI